MHDATRKRRWASRTEVLHLRAGLNTLAYSSERSTGGDVSLDYISIPNSIAPAARGATVPFVEYEAENASYIGTLIGPNYAFTSLPAEASGREAVQLNAQGQYVEFTLTQPANGLDLRYSIPDAADGSGLIAPLSLYINGRLKQALELTSKYGWFYGGYPFSNNPGDGTAHYFYDEVRAMTGYLPAGTKVRVQVDAADNAPWYVIDLADFYQVPAPYTKPTGYYNHSDRYWRREQSRAPGGLAVLSLE